MKKETSHPAYGIASFHRSYGTPGNLFGSSVKYDRYIELEISPAVESEDELGKKYHKNGVPYINIMFSPNQFAELITSMNIGSGIPCTVKQVNGKYVEKIPDDIREHVLDTQIRKFKEVMKDRLDNLHNAQKRISEIVDKPHLNKSDKEELKNILYKSIQDAEKNVPFFMEQIQDATDSIVQEAKSEIDATIQNCVMETGIQALGKEFKNKQLR